MMRIVLISEIFSSGMGYLENLLPKYLARCGAEVHVVASSLPSPHHQTAAAEASREAEPGLTPGSVTAIDGFHLHILQHSTTFGYVRLLGLSRKLKDLNPDIVQNMTPIGWIAAASAWNRLRLGYRLFSGCHYHASVFPLAQRALPFFHPARFKCHLQRALPGRIASCLTEKYYAISPDCAEVAARFFGVPRNKLELCPLGVDTEIFYPVSSVAEHGERVALRERLGFNGSEIVCVYSGRFGHDKNPLLLASAVARLASSKEPFRGLFIGNGPQAPEIAASPGCITQPFASMNQLAAYYRAADIGVWPAEESTSMLDSLACGLPLIANHTMHAPERLQGTGTEYRLGDVDDLVTKLRSLSRPETREQLGREAARRMREDFSWNRIAARRIEDYSTALRSRHAVARKDTAPAGIKQVSMKQVGDKQSGASQISAKQNAKQSVKQNIEQNSGMRLPASGAECE